MFICPFVRLSVRPPCNLETLRLSDSVIPHYILTCEIGRTDAPRIEPYAWCLGGQGHML